MNIQLVNPCKFLNKTFLRQKPLRSEIELFKVNPEWQFKKIDEFVYRIYGITEEKQRVIEKDS